MKEEIKIDRQAKLELYGEGPWLNEPDRIEWTSNGGLPCLLTRLDELGHLCGYVAVPPGHPLHGKGDDQLAELRVHGGVTYAQACHGKVCHVPAPGEPDDVWWIGFDCAHAGDESPSMVHRYAKAGEHQIAAAFRGTYRNVTYVKCEIEHLALQLEAIGRFS